MFYTKNYQIRNYRLNPFLIIILAGIFAGSVLNLTLSAQELPANTASPEASATPTPAPTPVPYSDIIAQTDAANSTLKEIASNTSANQTADIVERDLPSLTDEINARLEETANVIHNRTSLEKLRSFESDWRNLAKNLPQWKTDLTERARKLESNLQQIIELDKKWKATQNELANAGDVPPEISTRLQAIFTIINDTRRQIEIQQARIVSLQDKTAEQQKRVDGAIVSIRQTREALVGQLFVQDNPPIWSRQLWSQSEMDVRQALAASFSLQVKALNDFVYRNIGRIILHLFILIVFSTILIALRRRAERRVAKDETLKKAAVIFYRPISTALVGTILFSSWIYPQTPQILGAILGAVALVPTVLILRKLVERSLYPILYSLVIFYFIDQIRTITDSQVIVSRLLFLAEMLGGFIFFIWLYRTQLKGSLTETLRQNRVFRTFRYTLLIALPVFGIAFSANIFGFVGLSQLLGNAVLRSTYAALIFYAMIRIIDGLIIFALRFPPLSLLKMVKNYRALIQRRVRRFFRVVVIGLWILVALELLALREPVFGIITNILTARATIGSLSLSLSDIVAFGLTVWAAFLLSRFVRFALEEDVYPRVALERGLPYAISTLFKYAILLTGFFLAVGAAGFDLSKFTILAGAFGVGIGFGLQNIINNFVSGLILLFERPVKVGDIVKIGDASGTVRQIGIRASVIHVWDNSDIIVPNSKLISDNVTNWTFSSQQRGVEVVFNVLPETEPAKVIKIMETAAENHPLVLDTPQPQVLFDEITFEYLAFKLRVWTDYFDKTTKIRSDLVLNISEALNAENIPHEKINAEESKES